MSRSNPPPLVRNLPDVAEAILKRVDFRGIVYRTSTSLSSLHIAAFYGYKNICQEILAITGRWMARSFVQQDTMLPIRLGGGRGVEIPNRHIPTGSTPSDLARPAMWNAVALPS